MTRTHPLRAADDAAAATPHASEDRVAAHLAAIALGDLDDPTTAAALDPGVLRQLTASIAADAGTWRGRVRHPPEERWWTRLWWSPAVEVWLIGWEIDQDTQVHDHGGSRGAICVAEGVLTEDHAPRAGRRLVRRSHAAGAGAAFGASYVHNLLNLGPAPATSIHAYAPPLHHMRYYALDEDRRVWPDSVVPVDGPEPDATAQPRPLAAVPEV